MAGRSLRREAMRAELEKLIGPAAVDERPVRDLWPLSIMEVRDGKAPARVLVARPSGREQLTAVLRWAASRQMAVTPMGGGSGVCGALAPAAGGPVLDMGAFDRLLGLDGTNLPCRHAAGLHGHVLEQAP